MNHTIVCFACGLSGMDIEKGHAAFCEADDGTNKLVVAPVTEEMLSWNVGETVDEFMGKQHREGVIGGVAPGVTEEVHGGHRMVMIDCQDNARVIRIMRSFKSVLSAPRDIIFAVITDTARTWTFDEYSAQLSAEHEYMQNRSPIDDPDMKKME